MATASEFIPIASDRGYKHVTHSYGQENERQRLSVWFPQQSEVDQPSSGTRYWVIYIHGGAWRDPVITDTSFSATLKSLASETRAATSISSVIAFASIDYRLSPHPDFPQDAAKTPTNQLRDARHPQHARDVRTALAFLQNQYGFDENYLLVGHSCGATLAFQMVMDESIIEAAANNPAAQSSKLIPRPAAIIGVSGIYDLRLMRDNHLKYRVYHDFVVGAFGSDESKWDRVSPAKCAVFDKTWKAGRLAVLAHSCDDELVESMQLEVMHDCLQTNKSTDLDVSTVENLSGPHDELWREGDQIASLIISALDKLKAKSPF